MEESKKLNFDPDYTRIFLYTPFDVIETGNLNQALKRALYIFQSPDKYPLKSVKSYGDTPYNGVEKKVKFHNIIQLIKNGNTEEFNRIVDLDTHAFVWGVSLDPYNANINEEIQKILNIAPLTFILLIDTRSDYAEGFKEHALYIKPDSNLEEATSRIEFLDKVYASTEKPNITAENLIQISLPFFAVTDKKGHYPRSFYEYTPKDAMLTFYNIKATLVDIILDDTKINEINENDRGIFTNLQQAVHGQNKGYLDELLEKTKPKIVPEIIDITSEGEEVVNIEEEGGGSSLSSEAEEEEEEEEEENIPKTYGILPGEDILEESTLEPVTETKEEKKKTQLSQLDIPSQSSQEKLKKLSEETINNSNIVQGAIYVSDLQLNGDAAKKYGENKGVWKLAIGDITDDFAIIEAYQSNIDNAFDFRWNIKQTTGNLSLITVKLYFRETGHTTFDQVGTYNFGWTPQFYNHFNEVVYYELSHNEYDQTEKKQIARRTNILIGLSVYIPSIHGRKVIPDWLKGLMEKRIYMINLELFGSNFTHKRDPKQGYYLIIRNKKRNAELQARGKIDQTVPKQNNSPVWEGYNFEYIVRNDDKIDIDIYLTNSLEGNPGVDENIGTGSLNFMEINDMNGKSNLTRVNFTNNADKSVGYIECRLIMYGTERALESLTNPPKKRITPTPLEVPKKSDNSNIGAIFQDSIILDKAIGINSFKILTSINNTIRIVKNDSEAEISTLNKIVFITTSGTEGVTELEESDPGKIRYTEPELRKRVSLGNFYKLILSLKSKEEAVNITSAYSDKTDIFELFFDNNTYKLIDCAANDATISKMKKILGVPVSQPLPEGSNSAFWL